MLMMEYQQKPAVPIFGQSNAVADLNTSFKESLRTREDDTSPINRFVEIPEHVYERQKHQK